MRWQEKLTPAEIRHIQEWGVPKGVPITLDAVRTWLLKNLQPGKKCQTCENILAKLAPATAR